MLSKEEAVFIIFVVLWFIFEYRKRTDISEMLVVKRSVFGSSKQSELLLFSIAIMGLKKYL